MTVNYVKLGLAGFALASGMVLFGAGCERRDNPTDSARSQPAVQGQRAEALGAAVDSIATARCDREARCGNVGSGHHYESKDACMSSIRSNQSKDLNLTECPKGVDQKELNECLDQIRKDECNSPLDSISRIAACRTSDICQG